MYCFEMSFIHDPLGKQTGSGASSLHGGGSDSAQFVLRENTLSCM